VLLGAEMTFVDGGALSSAVPVLDVWCLFDISRSNDRHPGDGALKIVSVGLGDELTVGAAVDLMRGYRFAVLFRSQELGDVRRCVDAHSTNAGLDRIDPPCLNLSSVGGTVPLTAMSHLYSRLRIG
jgi:hypothetical protein